MTHASFDDLTASILRLGERRSVHDRELDEALRRIGAAKQEQLREVLRREHKLRVRRKADAE